MRGDEYHVVFHTDLRECFVVCFGTGPMSEIIRGCDSNGKYRITRKEYMAQLRKRHCWGWAQFEDKLIHIWSDAQCKPEVLVALIGHELGHLERPRPRNKKYEEQKADNYGRVARTAYEIAEQIIKKRRSK
jgi:hypothetical protein